MMLPKELRTRTWSYEKSVSVGGMMIYPLSDPAHVGTTLAGIIKLIEDRAFALGIAAAKREVRHTLGL